MLEVAATVVAHSGTGEWLATAAAGAVATLPATPGGWISRPSLCIVMVVCAVNAIGSCWDSRLLWMGLLTLELQMLTLALPPPHRRDAPLDSWPDKRFS